MVRQRLILVGLLALAAGCEARDVAPVKASRPNRYEIGRVASAQEVAAVNIDANPAGAGLPSGQGTAAAGATIFAGKCAACHGAHGEGIPPFPALIGKVPAPGFVFASDAKAVKTIGNYWPYATTLYDYIHRAMPFTAPGSLKPDEVYSLVAYLLSENGIVPATAVIDATSLPKVIMPAKRYFVTDNRTGGATFR